MLQAQLLRTLIKTIGEDKIKEVIAGLFGQAIAFAENYPLQEGETGLIGTLYHSNGKIMFSTATTCENEAGNTELLRFDNTKPVDDLIFSLLNQL